jgi:hypothetical protein
MSGSASDPLSDAGLDHARGRVFVLVGDTGIEPVASTVSTRLVTIVHQCWGTLRAA